MSDEKKTELRLEIAHVLFIDIVGFSKLLIDEQTEALQDQSLITIHLCPITSDFDPNPFGFLL